MLNPAGSDAPISITGRGDIMLCGSVRWVLLFSHVAIVALDALKNSVGRVAIWDLVHTTGMARKTIISSLAGSSAGLKGVLVRQNIRERRVFVSHRSIPRL
jgi:hypothetical protein